MTRLEAMENYLRPFMIDWMKKQIEGIKNEDNIECAELLNNLFLKACKRQQNNVWLPAYLSFYNLNSSYLTKTYQCQVCLSNNNMYLDEEQIYIYWCPSFRNQELETENKWIKQILEQKFVRIKDYEREYCLRLIIKEYEKIMEVYLKHTFEYVVKEVPFINMKKEKHFTLTYGDYMGEIKPIAIYKV